jgi:hypothetical protein
MLPMLVAVVVLVLVLLLVLLLAAVLLLRVCADVLVFALLVFKGAHQSCWPL